MENRSVNNRHMCLKPSPVFQPTAAMRARTPLCSDVKLSHPVLYDNHAVIAPNRLLKKKGHSGGLPSGVSDYSRRGPAQCHVKLSDSDSLLGQLERAAGWLAG